MLHRFRGIRDGYDVSDISLVATGVVFCMFLCVPRDEPFLFISVSVFFVLCFSLFFRASWIQNLPMYPAENHGYLSQMHLVFWVIQLIFALLYGTAQHAIHIHERQHRHAEMFIGIWVILGFTSGFTPGSGPAKLMEFAIASVAIQMRQLTLALTWEQSQADACRPVEVIANLLPTFTRDTVLRAAVHTSRVARAWLPVHGRQAHVPLADGPTQTPIADDTSGIDSPPADGCCVETDGVFACPELRLSVELMIGGFKSLGVAAFVGLCLGIIARSKWETAQLELKERRKEVAALLSHTVTLEAARREALVRETRRARHSPRGRQQLEPLDEGSTEEDDLTTFPGDAPDRDELILDSLQDSGIFDSSSVAQGMPLRRRPGGVRPHIPPLATTYVDSGTRHATRQW